MRLAELGDVPLPCRSSLLRQEVGGDGAADLGLAELQARGQGGGTGGPWPGLHRPRVAASLLQLALPAPWQLLRTSQLSRSAAVLVQPRRAHSTGLITAGLQNQVEERKVARRRKRSPRSQGRPLPPPAPAAAPPGPTATGRLGSSLCWAWRCGR